MTGIEAARTAAAAAITATTAIAAAESTTASAKSATAIAASKGASPTSETAAAVATGAHGRTAGKAILANLQHAALPVIAVELLDGGACVVGRLENDNARALGPTVRAEMNIGADNAACAGCRAQVVNAQLSNRYPGVLRTSLTEQVFQVLPTHVEGQLSEIGQYMEGSKPRGTEREGEL